MLSRLSLNVSRQGLLRSTVSAKVHLRKFPYLGGYFRLYRFLKPTGVEVIVSSSFSQKLAVSRHIHLVRVTQNLSTRGRHVIDLHKYQSVLGVLSVRHSSTVNNTPGYQGTVDSSAKSLESLKLEDINVTSNAAAETLPTNLFEQIPDLPALPIGEILDVAAKLHENGEPTFQSMDLGGWSPFGLIQYSLEWLHITSDLPWWATVVVMTVFLRAMTFPLVVKQRQNFADIMNHMPEVTKLQEKMSQAKQCGNKEESHRLGEELYTFVSEKNINPLKPLGFSFLQGSIFFSMFMALKGMANVPVDSLKHGGLWWFTDLTVVDPYYILPLISCATFGIILGRNPEAFAISPMMKPTHLPPKFLAYFSPLILFPILMNFPAIISLYWGVSNIITLILTILLDIPKVQEFLKIPKTKNHNVEVSQRKDFVHGFKDSLENIRISKEIGLRASTNAGQLRSNVKTGIQKTYDPTKKEHLTASGILAKKRR